ncbi:radical SAM protein [Streptomyces sp. NPDC088736]|uniref:radical SAM protein n=1 Tax=Streptomyces sp. NPDC088736 TaxID=3365881 RepID=UPI00381B94BB
MSDNRLNVAAKLQHPRFQSSVARVASGEQLSGPLVVDLDPTSFCDLDCPECISGDLLRAGRFPRERLIRIVQELIDLKVAAVVLIGGGEPLAHPATSDVISRLHEAGVAVGVVTNGTMIRRHFSALSQKTHWVRVSVDAASAETYSFFRPSRGSRDVFSEVISNVRELTSRSRGDVGFSFVLFSREQKDGRIQSNVHEIFAAAELARDLGCRYFELKASVRTDHHIEPQSDEILNEVEKQLCNAEKLVTQNFAIVLSSTLKVLRSRGRLDQPKSYDTCRVAKLRMLLTPTGSFVCSYHRGNQRMRTGDVQQSPVQKAWLSPGPAVPSRDCPFHCARHEMNLQLEQLQPQGAFDHSDRSATDLFL